MNMVIVQPVPNKPLRLKKTHDILFPLNSRYRAVGCIKMGKHKLTDEIAQRKRQKSKHKLKFAPMLNLLHMQEVSHHHLHDSSFDSPNEMAKNTDDEELDVDLDVVEMTFANPDSVYS